MTLLVGVSTFVARKGARAHIISVRHICLYDSKARGDRSTVVAFFVLKQANRKAPISVRYNAPNSVDVLGALATFYALKSE